MIYFFKILRKSISELNILLFFVLLNSTLVSQTINEIDKDSLYLMPFPNNFTSKFDHHGNIYYWLGKGRYDFIKNDFNLSLIEEFNSNIVESNQKYIQDYQNLKLNVSNNFFDDLKYSLIVNSSIYSDNKSIGISNAYTHTGLLGLIFNPVDYFTFSSYGGGSLDNQMGNKDEGFSFLLNSKINNYDLGGYLSNLEAEWNIDYLNPRINNQKKMNLNIQKRFSGEAWSNLTFYYRKFDKDFYVNDASTLKQNIERRSELNVFISNEIGYRPLPQIMFSLNTFFLNKKVNRSTKYKSLENLSSSIFDTKINEIKLDMLFQISTDFGWMKNNFKFGTNQREENHTLDYFEGASKNYFISRSKAESYKDNVSNSSILALSNYFLISSKNILTLQGIYKLLRYDTPIESNYDDRDELQILLSVNDEHRFQDNLSLVLNFEYNKYRTIFIFSERSANNQSNNILKFYTYTQYFYNDYFKTKALFEVLANYTVYDYKDKILSLKNLSFRQFQVFDSTSIFLTKIIFLDLFANLRFSERGELFWDSFKEKPADYYIDETYAITFWYKKMEYAFGIGYKTFTQTRFLYENNRKVKDYEQNNFGPTACFSYRISDYFSLNLSGWLEYIEYQNNIWSKNKNIVIDFLYLF